MSIAGRKHVEAIAEVLSSSGDGLTVEQILQKLKPPPKQDMVKHALDHLRDEGRAERFGKRGSFRYRRAS